MIGATMMQHAEEAQQSYRYSELDKTAQERTRDWWVSLHASDNWWSDTYFDISECARLLGIEIQTEPVGKTQVPGIYFTLNYSQGDYAAFEGSWTDTLPDLQDEASALRVKVLGRSTYTSYAEAIASYATQDEKLAKIAIYLDAVRAFNELHSVYLYATSTFEGRDRVSITAELLDESATTKGANTKLPEHERLLVEALKSFNAWMLEQLRESYEYQTSEECVAECLELNDYRFNEHGEVQLG